MWMGQKGCRDETELQSYCKMEGFTFHLVLLRSSAGLTHGPEQQYTTLSNDGVKRALPVWKACAVPFFLGVSIAGIIGLCPKSVN